MRRRVFTALALVLLVGGLAQPAFAKDQLGAFNTPTGEWGLENPTTGQPNRFYFGNPGDLPMVGDWDGDGVDTPGLYRQADGFVYLRNSNSQGIADIRFFFGNPGDVPLAGDFDGDGFDSVSIYRPSERRVYIINSLGANEGGLGVADFAYPLGGQDDQLFVGDFDGDGDDEVGLFRESSGEVLLRYSTTPGPPDVRFFFGVAGDLMFSGDWDGDGVDTVGLNRPFFQYGWVPEDSWICPVGWCRRGTTGFIKDSNQNGPAREHDYRIGSGPIVPLAGDWGQLPIRWDLAG